MAIEKWNAPVQGREKVGFDMVKVGGGGLALWGIAGVLPIVTFPMLLVLALVVGLIYSL